MTLKNTNFFIINVIPMRTIPQMRQNNNSMQSVINHACSIYDHMDNLSLIPFWWSVTYILFFFYLFKNTKCATAFSACEGSFSSCNNV